MVKRSHIGLNMHYISIPMAYSSAFERLRSYVLNGSIARSGGAIKMHLMDSSLDMGEVEQNSTLKIFISMTMVVHVEMDLMELPM